MDTKTEKPKDRFKNSQNRKSQCPPHLEFLFTPPYISEEDHKQNVSVGGRF